MKNEGYLDDLKYVPQHKMGFKILEENQLENMFPGYNSIMANIKEHREFLENFSGDYEKMDSQYNLMYDNVFSIMGERGSGKTSAVFTLKCILQNDSIYKDANIVLPVIMPEMVPVECSLIGWILSVLEEVVNDLDKKLNEKQVKISNFNKCLNTAKESLKREYEQLKELCYSRFYSGEAEESLSTLIDNTDRKTQNSYDFSKRISVFWTRLKRAISEANDLPKDKEPLIFIIFDDVDLVPVRVMDIFATIMKYLSHPNIMVFITASEKLLYDVIENDMNNRMTKYEEMSMYGQMYKVNSYYEEEDELNGYIRKKMENFMHDNKAMHKFYGDKILPPSRRYYLELFDTCKKKSTFIKEVQNDKDGKVSNITMKAYMEELVEAFCKSCNTESFLRTKDDVFINAYFKFWGTTSRQIANESFIMKQFFDRINRHNVNDLNESNEDDYVRKLYYEIYYFVHNTLNTNGNFKELFTDLKKFVDNVLCYYPDNKKIVIQYSYLWEVFVYKMEVEEFSNMKEAIDELSSVFILLFWVERILDIISKSGKNLHNIYALHGNGDELFVNVLNSITKGDNSLICKILDSREDFLVLYENVLEHPEVLQTFDLMKKEKVQDYVEKLPDYDFISVNRGLKYYVRNNGKWLETITKMLYLSNEKIYKITKKDFFLEQLQSEITVFDSYFKRQINLEEEKFSRRSMMIENVLCYKKNEEQYSDAWKKMQKGVKEVKTKCMLDIKKEFDSLEAIDYEIRSCLIKEYDELNFVLQNVKCKRIIESVVKEKEYNKYTDMLKNVENICREIKETLIEEYRYLRAYKVSDVNRLNFIVDDIRRGAKFSVFNLGTGFKTVNVVRASAVREFAQSIFNELAEMKNRNSSFSSSMEKIDMYENSFFNLNEILSLAIVNKEDLERGENIVMLHRALILMEELYWQMLLDKSELEKSKQDTSQCECYKVLYDNIIEKLNEEQDSYLKSTLTQYIEDGLRDYYSAVTGGTNA